MNSLSIDIETYSSADLMKCGVYRYVEAPDFVVLLIAYSVDGGEAVCVDLTAGERLPADVERALTDPSVTKRAFNAAFERVCLSKWLGLAAPMSARGWECTMVQSARAGLPLSLGDCAKVLRLKQQKMTEGRALVRLFSKPGRKGRTMRGDAPEKWETFKEYCRQDVMTEMAIYEKVKRVPVAPFDAELYIADQEINDRGVMIHRRMVEMASLFDAQYKAGLLQQARELTGCENPNSPAQLKEWIHKVTEFSVASLNKGSLDELAGKLALFPQVTRMLELRKEMGKTSNKKYDAMLDCVCQDGRMHGLLQFYGAARTGRFAGRLVQLQNLPQNHIDDLDTARRVVISGDLEDFELQYTKPMNTLSELIRTALIAPEGKTLHVCDFSAIEARVIAWLAGEGWVLDVFKQGGDIYCASASQMFGVPVSKHGENSHLRQKGKIAVLALGYGGGVAALEAMGGARMGLHQTEMQDIVKLWRRSNPKIVKLWQIVESAAVNAIKTGKEVQINRGIAVGRQWGMLTITLPSGRMLCYPRARIGIETDDGWRGDHEVIEYEGVNQTSRQWCTSRTYGGKLVENIVQAVARDILGEVLLKARERGMQTVFHVHDEIVVEADGSVTLRDVEAIFDTPPAWCKDLPLKGAGYSTNYYKKD